MVSLNASFVDCIRIGHSGANVGPGRYVRKNGAGRGGQAFRQGRLLDTFGKWEIREGLIANTYLLIGKSASDGESQFWLHCDQHNLVTIAVPLMELSGSKRLRSRTIIIRSDTGLERALNSSFLRTSWPSLSITKGAAITRLPIFSTSCTQPTIRSRSHTGKRALNMMSTGCQQRRRAFRNCAGVRWVSAAACGEPTGRLDGCALVEGRNPRSITDA